MVGARELGAKLGRQGRFIARVCHERGIGERGGRPWETSTNKAARARHLVEPGDLAWFDWCSASPTACASGRTSRIRRTSSTRSSAVPAPRIARSMIGARWRAIVSACSASQRCRTRRVGRHVARAAD